MASCAMKQHLRHHLQFVSLTQTCSSLYITAWHKWNVTWLPTPLQRIFATIGLLPLIVHRSLLENDNLLGTPPHVDPKGRKPPPEGGCPFRPDDGYGTDVNNPTASMDGAPIGRNMQAVPKHLRNHRGAPDVQLVAQRLLAREDFVPAGEQLNITAAAWIQAMVHDWIQHEDGAKTSLENEKLGPECPLKNSMSLKLRNGLMDISIVKELNGGMQVLCTARIQNKSRLVELAKAAR